MGVISSNTLFHFTSSTDVIISILKNGFFPRFSLEESGPELFFKMKKKDFAIPLTSFCDLPLSLIKEHLEFYGKYGVGMSKEWGVDNGITPLTYIHEKSIQIKYLKEIGNIIYKLNEFNTFHNLPLKNDPFFSLLELSAFYKPYKGKMYRNNKYIKKKYYDEKEWRYTPFIANNDGVDYRLNKEEFLDINKRENANKKLEKEYALKFKSKDIKYLIVSMEKEKIRLFNLLNAMKNEFTSDEIKILQTKIISSEEILEDI